MTTGSGTPRGVPEPVRGGLPCSERSARRAKLLTEPGPLHELPESRLDLELAVLDDDPSPDQRHVDIACDLDAFVEVVVRPRVLLRRGDRLLPVRIEDHDVGVRARRDRALAGIEAE